MSIKARKAKAYSLYKRSLNLDDIRALMTLTRAYKLDKRNIHVLFRFGYIYHKMNRKKKAIEFYRRTIRRMPCHVKAINNMGGIFLDLNRQYRAEKLYLRAIRCNKRFYAAYYNLGSIYQKRELDIKAKRYYIYAIRLKSDHYRSRHNLGQIYAILAYRSGLRESNKRQLLRKALYQFNKACSIKPNNAINQYSLGKLLIKMGRFKEGLRVMEKALQYSKKGSSLQMRIQRSIHNLKEK